MSEPSTYIKIDRNILDWGWYQEPNTMRLFIHLLLKANIKEKEWMGKTIQRGELATSYSNLAKELKLSVKNVRTALEHLKSTNEVAIKTSPKYTIISISNYDKYQLGGTQSGKQVANNRQTDGKQVATTKEYKNVIIKEYIKENNVKEKFEKFWIEYPEGHKIGKGKAFEAFNKAIQKTDIETMISALKSQKESLQWKRDNGQYIPHPTTWLNQERWNDQLTPYTNPEETRSSQRKQEYEELAKKYGNYL